MHCPPRAVSAVLASLLSCTSLSVRAANPASSQSNVKVSSGHADIAEMIERAKALHALNRLAFGPRPGEVEAVEAIGVEHWIDLQLHPEKMNDSALRQRLALYKAPFMDPQALMMDFPPANLIRQALQGRVTVPSDEPQKAVWESQIARMQQRRKSQASQQMLSTQPDVMASADAAPAPTTQSRDRATAESRYAETSSLLVNERACADRDTADLLDLPTQQRYEKLLHMQPGHLQECWRSLPPDERPAFIAGMTPAQRETVIALLNPRMVVVNEAEDVRLLQDIYSERQLQRVMTEFWLNHFNIFVNKNQVEPYYLPQFQQEVIAPRALGKFEDLLDAVAQSPAMLLYLDNQQSVGPSSLFALQREHPGIPRFQLVQMMTSSQPAGTHAPSMPQSQDRPLPGINENYGRELMELHTVGVNGGYTQQDVIEAAKVLTGWTVAPPQQGGGFRFNENRHEPGEKIVMGHRIQADGEQEGLELLHILATSPSTARLISTELAVRFVSDTPPPSLVDRMAKTFLSSDGDIGMVLETMIHSREFWSAADSGNKIKTPLDYVVSAVRATNADVSQPYRLVSELRLMGMPLAGTQQPNGYAMTNDAWASTSELMNRMNFALALASNRIPGVTVSLDQFAGQAITERTPARQEISLEQAILNGPASPRMHQAVLTSLRDTPAQNQAATSMVLTGDSGGDPFATGLNRHESPPTNLQAAVIAGLLIGSPEFQRR